MLAPMVVVDLDYNRIITSEEIPPIPEPEYSFLRGEDVLFKFFATLLSGYQNFLENSFTQVFNTQAFLKKQSRATNQSPEPMVLLRIQELECSKIIHLELKGTNAYSKVNYH
ncbi:DENN domain and WD repeat-containing protein SCD1-like isoform X4 [Arachis hypogaea]|uniref:DENN domain and WD repeat-containing protein SCD1-like isoform X4 n=1 Tax=Arachis hypogaea TaxID=3818 RepID=UPI000A2C3EC0|nr:DENN domain and WD repeat-containing protein [Arachis hypogaea]